MSAEPPRLPGDSPAEWLRYARSDLAFAQVGLGPDMMLETHCYHAQQAAEKAVKAVVIHRTSTLPPKTHDLGRLLRLLGSPGDFPSDVAEASRLSEYVLSAGYPDTVGEIDEDERAEAVRLAKAVVAWAEAEVRRGTWGHGPGVRGR